MKDTTLKPPTWFYVLAIILLLWNALGLMAFISQMTMGTGQLEALSDAERSLYENFPIWATVAFAFAVTGGTLGCVGLLLRRTWAKPLFVVSLIGIVIQMVYNFFLSQTTEVYGPGAIAMPIMVLIIGIFLIWFTNYCQNRGWLRS